MKMLRVAVPLGFAVVSACVTLPRAGAPALPDYNFRMRDFKLPNGLRIIVEEDHGSPLVGIFNVVGVGSTGDPKGKEGLAHLLEHLTFRAKHDGRITVWNRLDLSGAATNNAFTNFDTTVYYEVGPKEMLPNLLALEGARIAMPVPGVDEAVLNVEREVVRNELRQRGEMAVGPEFAWLQSAVFPPEHPYSRPTVGTHESLSAITLQDVKDFTQKHYRPENMTLLIIGDVDLATIDKVLDKALPKTLYTVPEGFKPTFGSRLPKVAAEPPAPPPAQLKTYQAVVPTPELYLAWSLPRSVDGAGVLQQFVTAAAQGALSEAWQGDSDIVSVQVELVDGVEASMLLASIPLHKGDHVEKTKELVLDQLVKLWSGGDLGSGEESDSQVEGAIKRERAFGQLRNQAVMRMTAGAEDIQNRGTERAVATHFTGDPLVYSRMLKSLGGVSIGQVLAFAGQYLTRDRARAIVIEPLKADAKGAANTGLGDPSGEANAVKANYTASAVKDLGRAKMVEGATEATLQNGLHVVVVPRRGGLPVVTLALGMPGGKAGSDPLAAADLAEEVAQPHGHRYGRPSDYGIFLSDVVGDDVHAVTLQGAIGNLPNMLAILSEHVKTQYVEPGAAVIFRRDNLEYLREMEALPDEQADRAGKKALFGAHPYGHVTSTKELDEVSDSEAEGFVKRSLSPKGATLVISGNVEAAQVLPLATQWLEDWSPRGEALKEPARPKPPEKARQVIVVHRPGATQVEVQLACLGPEPTPKQEAAQSILAELVGSTLFIRVREELGATYGLHGSASTLRGGVGLMEWQGSVEKARFTKALGVVKDVLEKTAAADEQAFGKARWQMARQATMRGGTSRSVARTVLRELMLGRNVSSADYAIDTLAEVTRDDLLEAWSACQKSQVFTFVGDQETIEQAVKSVGW